LKKSLPVYDAASLRVEAEVIIVTPAVVVLLDWATDLEAEASSTTAMTPTSLDERMVTELPFVVPYQSTADFSSSRYVVRRGRARSDVAVLVCRIPQSDKGSRAR
jgi:hypothetical protein